MEEVERVAEKIKESSTVKEAADIIFKELKRLTGSK